MSLRLISLNGESATPSTLDAQDGAASQRPGTDLRSRLSTRVFPTEHTGGATHLPRSGAFFGDTLGESEALVENAGGFAIERTIGTVNVNAFVEAVATFDSSLFQRLQQQDAAQSSEAEIVVVEVAVTDSGCGIDKADALRLFEAFQQVRKRIERLTWNRLLLSFSRNY